MFESMDGFDKNFKIYSWLRLKYKFEQNLHQ